MSNAAAEVAKKNLVYFFITGSPDNARLLVKCVESINENLTTPGSVDFVALCDPALAPILAGVPDVRVVSTPPNPTPLDQARRKLQVFDLIPTISDYNAVLFMDHASLLCGCINRTFATCISQDKLYIITEPGRPEIFGLPHYGLQQYTERERLFFSFSNIHPFSTRQFMFKPTSQLQEHFANVLKLMDGYTGQFVGDQSFCNHYFLKASARYIDKTTMMRFFMFIRHADVKFDPTYPFIATFPGPESATDVKIAIQDAYSGGFMESKGRSHRSNE